MTTSEPEIKNSAGSRKGGLRFFVFYSRIVTLAGLICCLLLVDCGYHRIRPGNNVPSDVTSIAVPVFRNDSYEPGIEVLLTEALREQFLRSGFVRLTDVKNADAVVAATVKKFSLKAISFSETDYATEYRASVVMRIKLVTREGKVLWQDRNVSRVEDFRVSVDIFQTEAAKQQATAKIARDLMADVHDRIFDGFDIGFDFSLPTKKPADQ